MNAGKESEEDRAPEEQIAAEERAEKRAETLESIRRILVALDASPHSLAALQAAVELASNLNAELEGVYVEDINLIRVAELPLARELSVFSAVSRPYDRSTAERQLRIQARQAERALANFARRASLTYTFRVAQGSIWRELLTAGVEHDIIFLGKAGWNRYRTLGSTARALASRFPRLVMLLQYGARLGLPIGVVFDGSALARRALDVAAQYLPAHNDTLLVILTASDLEEARIWQADIEAWAGEQELQTRFRWLVRPSPGEITNLVRTEGLGALVLPAEMEWLHEERLAEMLGAIDTPVLLVR